jgi:hypothetical protein
MRPWWLLPGIRLGLYLTALFTGLVGHLILLSNPARPTGVRHGYSKL